MAKVMAGLKIIELAGLAPAPFAAMMLADHGAEVIRVEREGAEPSIPPDYDILPRGRAEVLRLDLKSQEGVARVPDRKPEVRSVTQLLSFSGY
jgi:alpha-methylacyl-CoA racemase